MDEDDEDRSRHNEVDRVQGDVRFDNVGFSYGDDDGPVIDGAQCRSWCRSTLAIVGHSGSGKTTLASLLPRFYELDSGDILIDGVSIRDFTLGQPAQQHQSGESGRRAVQRHHPKQSGVRPAEFE